MYHAIKNVYVPVQFGDAIELNPKRSFSKSMYATGIRALRSCFKNMRFSRFPYFVGTNNKRCDSLQCALSKNQGNCVAFARYVQHYMLMRGYEAHLACSQTPSMYRKPGFLHVSHAVVVAPFRDGYMMMDAAFYMNKPIVVSRDGVIGDEYVIEHAYNRKDDAMRMDFRMKQKHTEEDIEYDYVKIPAHTPVIEGKLRTGDDEHYETVNYYLRDILNPDESLTTHTNYYDRRIMYTVTNSDGKIQLYLSLDLRDPDDVVLKCSDNLMSLSCPSLHSSDLFSPRRKDGTRSLRIKTIKTWSGFQLFCKHQKRSNKKCCLEKRECIRNVIQILRMFIRN